jgi:hypothetical protein
LVGGEDTSCSEWDEPSKPAAPAWRPTANSEPPPTPDPSLRPCSVTFPHTYALHYQVTNVSEEGLKLVISWPAGSCAGFCLNEWIPLKWIWRLSVLTNSYFFLLLLVYLSQDAA